MGSWLIQTPNDNNATPIQFGNTPQDHNFPSLLEERAKKVATTFSPSKLPAGHGASPPKPNSFSPTNLFAKPNPIKFPPEPGNSKV